MILYFLEQTSTTNSTKSINESMRFHLEPVKNMSHAYFLSERGEIIQMVVLFFKHLQ